MSQHFAAIASFTAQIAEPLAKAQPTNSASVLIMNGTKDLFVPYEGGDVTPALFPRLSKMLKLPARGKVISTDATIEFWLRHNEIDTKGITASLLDIDVTDRSTVERTEWINERTGVSVLLYKIIGGDHTCFGGGTISSCPYHRANEPGYQCIGKDLGVFWPTSKTSYYTYTENRPLTKDA